MGEAFANIHFLQQGHRWVILPLLLPPISNQISFILKKIYKRMYQIENVHKYNNVFFAKRPAPGSWESFAFMWGWIIKEQYKLYLIAIYNYFTILAKGFPLINGKMFQYKTWFTAFLVLNAMKMKIKSRFQAQRCWKQAHFNTSHQNRFIQELLCKTLAWVL